MRNKTDRNAKLTFALTALTTFVALGGAFAVAAEPKADSQPAKKAETGPPKLYTNTDLPPDPSPGGRTYTNKDLPQAEPQPAPSAGAARAITNEDLSRMFPEPIPPTPPPAESEPAADPHTEEQPAGEGSTEPTATPPPQAGNEPDALEQLESEQRAVVVRQQLIQETEASLAGAREKVKQLEVQLLAVSNPFSARPQLSEEEQEKRRTSGETAIERRARTEEMIEAAREEVTTLEARLQELRRQS